MCCPQMSSPSHMTSQLKQSYRLTSDQWPVQSGQLLTQGSLFVCDSWLYQISNKINQHNLINQEHQVMEVMIGEVCPWRHKASGKDKRERNLLRKKQHRVLTVHIQEQCAQGLHHPSISWSMVKGLGGDVRTSPEEQ